MLQIESDVIQWASDRGIFQHATPQSQLLKTFDELGELCRAAMKHDVDGMIDGIGDVIVTLIIQCHMHGVSGTPSFLLEQNVDAIKAVRDDGKFDVFDRVTVLLYTGEFLGMLASVMDYSDLETIQPSVIEAVCGIMAMMAIMADLINTSAQACLDAAYSVILHRTGSMQNGVFVKEAGQ